MEIFDEIRFKLQQGNAVAQIVLINVVIYLSLGLITVFGFLFNKQGISEQIAHWLMLPASLGNFIRQPWSIVSYMFLHQNFLHILFNMLWLYWLGSLFQQYLGNSKTWQAYFLGGLFGGIVYMVSYNVFPVFASQLQNNFALGASAGVLSLVVATATLLPDHQVVLFLFGAVRLKYIALIAIVIDFLSIPGGNSGGHIAHLGGSAFGFLFIKLIYSQSNIPDALDKAFETLSGNRKSAKNLKIHHKGPQIRVENNDKPSQSEIDKILDKISRSGYESLSKKEKDILFKAGKD